MKLAMFMQWGKLSSYALIYLRILLSKTNNEWAQENGGNKMAPKGNRKRMRKYVSIHMYVFFALKVVG